MNEKKSSPLWHRPTSKAGRWAVGLSLVFLVFWMIDMVIIATRSSLPVNENIPLINFGFFWMADGLAAGIVALIAILRKNERSWAVWLSLFPGVFMLTLIVGEFIGGH